MINVICDACKKSIPGPSRGRNVKTLLNKDLCLDCYHKLEAGVADAMGKSDEFHISDHDTVRGELLTKMTR